MMISFFLLFFGAAAASAPSSLSSLSAIACPPNPKGRSMRPSRLMTRYKGPRRARAITHATLGLQWLMEPFFCPSGGKKLPGHYGQQDLSAGPLPPRANA
jgi:hypothetical protein